MCCCVPNRLRICPVTRQHTRMIYGYRIDVYLLYIVYTRTNGARLHRPSPMDDAHHNAGPPGSWTPTPVMNWISRHCHLHDTHFFCVCLWFALHRTRMISLYCCALFLRLLLLLSPHWSFKCSKQNMKRKMHLSSTVFSVLLLLLVTQKDDLRRFIFYILLFCVSAAEKYGLFCFLNLSICSL